MAKRSPILGYNHNVRYRGLVFHVQTEDSGVLSPHLFTHLFHHGVIVSTRKLVYDSGSAEEAIKALMQAQHKAVLKELKRGQFDDKIDQYLGGTPGLLARGAVDDHAEPTDPERASPPEIARPSQPVMAEMVEATFGQRTDAEIAMSREPTIEEPAIGLRPTEPAVEQRLPARTASGDMQRLLARTASGDLHRLLARTVSGDDIYDQTVRVDPNHEIFLELDDDDDDDEAAPADNNNVRPPRRRIPRDTDVAPLDDHTRPTLDIAPISDGVPGRLPIAPTLRTPNDVAPPPLVTPPVTPPPVSATAGREEPSAPARAPSTRASTAVGASALPPARPISRPPSRASIGPPQVVSRMLPAEDRRAQSLDAIEVYAPAPPSAELPPPPSPSVELPPHADAPERPGQYSQHKKISTRIPMDVVRDGPRPLHPQQGSVPTTSAPPSRAGSAGMPGAAAPRAPSSMPPPPPPAALRGGGGTPLMIPASSSGPTTRPGGPAPLPAPPRSGVPVVPAPASSSRPSVPPPARPPEKGPPSRPTPMPGSMPIPGSIPRPATNGPAAAVAVADTVKTRTPGTATPAAGVPTAVAATAATAPASSPVPAPVPAVQAASGAATTPTPSRTASVGSPSGGVVLTRPAVIVGAPGKSGPATQRIRKAREDEGRAFGQGLISEKSLDEVILAYLSEDAEDK